MNSLIKESFSAGCEMYVLKHVTLNPGCSSGLGRMCNAYRQTRDALRARFGELNLAHSTCPGRKNRSEKNDRMHSV